MAAKAFELLRAVCLHALNADAERPCARFHLFHLGAESQVCRIHQDGDSLRMGDCVFQKLQLLAEDLRTGGAARARDVSPGAPHAGNQPQLDRIGRENHHNGNAARRLLRRQRGGPRRRDDQVDFFPNQLGG